MDEAKRKILVVDDEPAVRELLCATLSDDFQVREAEDGIKGLAIARQWHPDLVLCDVIMPGSTGIEVCRELKTTMERPPVVVLITALGTESHIEQGLAAGADSYFVKPFKPRALLEKIAEVFGGQDMLTPQVVATEKETPEREIGVEQVRFYARNLKELYEEERKGRMELERRVRELSALNRLFQGYLQERWDNQEAINTLAEGIINLAKEAERILEARREHKNHVSVRDA